MKNIPIYHVGLAISRSGRIATFQYRKSVDSLSCEIYKYFGERQTTKSDAKKRLTDRKAQIIEQLRSEYPKKNIQNVRID